MVGNLTQNSRELGIMPQIETTETIKRRTLRLMYLIQLFSCIKNRRHDNAFHNMQW